MKKNLVLDFRMSRSSGIGEYIRNIYDLISSSIESVSKFEGTAEIYSLKEQIEILRKVAPCNIFWSPHYNVPIFLKNVTKRLVTIHDVYHLAYYNKLTLKQKIYAKIMINMAVRISSKIITVSNFSKSEIIKYTKCDASKIEVIANGTRQKSVIKDFSVIKERYNIPDKYILYVGNVKPHKNLKVLIEAFSLLSAFYKENLSIVIVGKRDGFITNDNTLGNTLDSNPEISNKIFFTGFVDDQDIDTLYKHANLFVFPSLYEGFGLPPLEAMLNSCPVISSNVASMPEVCGDAVLYFDPKDSHGLAGKIEEVIEDQDLRNELIIKGRERVKMFTWEISAKKHVNLINSILN